MRNLWKRNFALLLEAVLFLSMTACGGDSAAAGENYSTEDCYWEVIKNDDQTHDGIREILEAVRS